MTKKMAVPAGTIPGTETDGKGNYIPLEQRTETDQRKVHDFIAEALKPDSSDNKNPHHEFEEPAPREGTRGKIHPPHDLQGHQGGQRGGSREP